MTGAGRVRVTRSYRRRNDGPVGIERHHRVEGGEVVLDSRGHSIDGKVEQQAELPIGIVKRSDGIDRDRRGYLGDQRIAGERLVSDGGSFLILQEAAEQEVVARGERT